jgi:hypothetical protein
MLLATSLPSSRCDQCSPRSYPSLAFSSAQLTCAQCAAPDGEKIILNRNSRAVTTKKKSDTRGRQVPVPKIELRLLPTLPTRVADTNQDGSLRYSCCWIRTVIRTRTRIPVFKFHYIFWKNIKRNTSETFFFRTEH